MSRSACRSCARRSTTARRWTSPEQARPTPAACSRRSSLPSSSHRPRKRFGQHFLHDPWILEKIIDAIQPAEDDRIVGNLPYNISTPLLFHLARYAERVRDMHFMLQLEVVERMVAAHSTPQYGRLSVALQARFKMKKLFNVSKGAFNPPPKVESAVVRLEPLPKILNIDEDLLRKAFSARRKTLRNALPGIDFAALGIDSGLRPENLSPEDYLRLSMNSI